MKTPNVAEEARLFLPGAAAGRRPARGAMALAAALLLAAAAGAAVFAVCTLQRVAQLEGDMQRLRTTLKELRDLLAEEPYDDPYPEYPPQQSEALAEEQSGRLKSFDGDYYDTNYEDFNYDEGAAAEAGDAGRGGANVSARSKRTIAERPSDRMSVAVEGGRANVTGHPPHSPPPEEVRTTPPDEGQGMRHSHRYGRLQRQRVKSSFKSAEPFRNAMESTEFTVVREDQMGRGRGRHRHVPLNLESFEDGERPPRPGRARPLPSVHYSGDTSRYVYGQHPNFNGNGHLRHPRKTFVDWMESDWVRGLGMDQHFEMIDGFLIIKETGLYFVYAQIYYLDEHDTNGFRVHRNDDTILQCTVMTHSFEKVKKGNTCYTAGVEYLVQNDRISLKDLSEARYSIFEPGKSFFGIIKLGDAKIK